MPARAIASFLGSSPHTRGAHQRRRKHRREGRDHPRIRGEHLRRGMPPPTGGGSSPHTRGARMLDRVTQTLLGDHPRIRGEHAGEVRVAVAVEGSSPHTRGARRADRGCGVDGGIIPAYAGSTRCRSRRRGRSRDHPRIRGEHDLVVAGDSVFRGSSPHTRGAPSAACRNRVLREDHPRIRGEHAVDVRADRRRRGSSPHTRGARELGRHLLFDAGIIPAYAGSTFARDVEVADETGSSPHTRGALRRSLRLGRRGRIIPAYAGSTCARFLRRRGVPDHPRIRGEHNICASVCDSPVGSSPHTRGAPPSTFPKASAWRIIPAYAGSTGHTQPHGQLFADHPRIRGEHPLLLRCEFEWLGSSPHTRGAL